MGILYISITLIFFMESVISKVDVKQTSDQLKKTERIVKKRNLIHSTTVFPEVVISRLHSLQADVDKYVATYRRPSHFVTLGLQQYRKRTCSSKTGWTRATKSTTRLSFYVTKRPYPKAADRRDSIFSYLLNVFSLYNDTLKAEIMSRDNIVTRKSTPCYLKAHSTFMEHCFYAYFLEGGIKRMRKFLAQVCSVEWINGRQIAHVLENCCRRRFKFELFRYTHNPDRPTKMTFRTFGLL